MFTHLHVHSSYSDGLAHPFDLMRQARSLGFTTLALTDHNTLDGHPAFLAAAQRYQIAPILGAELRVHTSFGHGHMVVLSDSEEGYARLHWLVRRKKKVWLNDLKGIGPVTSGCLGGVAAQLLQQNDYWSARDALRECRSILTNNFFIEIQPTFGVVLAWLLSLARELHIPMVATNDVHYLLPEDGLRHTNIGLYLATEAQMRISCPFADYRYALENTTLVADACAWNSGHTIANYEKDAV